MSWTPSPGSVPADSALKGQASLRGQPVEHGLGHLAPAGVVDANKEHLSHRAASYFASSACRRISGPMMNS